YYRTKVVPKDVFVRDDNLISVMVLTGPLSITKLKDLMIITSTFNAGFGKVIFGFINSPEQALKIAGLPGVIEIEADQIYSLKNESEDVLDMFHARSKIPGLPDPPSINQFESQDIHGITRVNELLGINGSGVTITIHDTGIDFSNLDLGYDALARTQAGNPAVFDPMGDGLVLTPAVVTMNASGYLNVSDIETRRGLDI
ncbi:MAG: hypothetical protein ACFFBD_15780, partial [Candidatus Hodarchaeota archaeon]